MAAVRSTVAYADASKALDAVKSDIETDIGSVHVIPKDRYDEVIDLIGDHFLPDQPVCRAFGMTRSPLLDHQYQKRLGYNLSIMMVNKQTQDVMGAGISHILGQGELLNAGLPKETQDVVIFSDKIQNGFSVFDELRSDEILRFAILAVSKEYRQLGVGGQLMKASVAFARKFGFRAIKSQGDSMYAQTIFEKNGFVVLKEVLYDSYIYEGEPLGNRTGVHRNTKIYCKWL